MSHMNINFGIISYEDSSVTNPTVRSLDVSRSLTGIAVMSERTDKAENLAPGESRVIASTLRPVTQDATTVYNIIHPFSDNSSIVRLQWSGAGSTPGFATKRSILTSASSVVSIERLNSATCRISATGVLINTASVQIGDWIKFEASNDYFTSLFSPVNQQAFRVIAKGSGYVDVTDNGVMSEDQNITLGADYDMQMRVFSNGPVKINDIIEISGAGQNPNNAGKFQILEISYDYVQFINPYASDMSFAVGTDVVQIYDRLMGFLFIRANDTVSLKINDGNPVKIQRIGAYEALFLGSVQAFKIELINEEQSAVSATVYYSSLV